MFVARLFHNTNAYDEIEVTWEATLRGSRADVNVANRQLPKKVWTMAVPNNPCCNAHGDHTYEVTHKTLTSIALEWTGFRAPSYQYEGRVQDFYNIVLVPSNSIYLRHLNETLQLLDVHDPALFVVMPDRFVAKVPQGAHCHVAIIGSIPRREEETGIARLFEND